MYESGVGKKSRFQLVVRGCRGISFVILCHKSKMIPIKIKLLVIKIVVLFQYMGVS